VSYAKRISYLKNIRPINILLYFLIIEIEITVRLNDDDVWTHGPLHRSSLDGTRLCRCHKIPRFTFQMHSGVWGKYMRILMRYYILYDYALSSLTIARADDSPKTSAECENTSMYNSSTRRTQSGLRFVYSRAVRLVQKDIDRFIFMST